MACAVSLRGDYSATELRGLASATKNANQSRRLLSLAAVLDGMNRTEAARIGGSMPPATLGGNGKCRVPDAEFHGVETARHRVLKRPGQQAQGRGDGT